MKIISKKSEKFKNILNEINLLLIFYLFILKLILSKDINLVFLKKTFKNFMIFMGNSYGFARKS